MPATTDSMVFVSVVSVMIMDVVFTAMSLVLFSLQQHTMLVKAVNSDPAMKNVVANVATFAAIAIDLSSVGTPDAVPDAVRPVDL
jgi:hypothetical protein